MSSDDVKRVAVKSSQDLIEVVQAHPTYRIVTDVGMSMCSGWGDLKEIVVFQNDGCLELIFD